MRVAGTLATIPSRGSNTAMIRERMLLVLAFLPITAIPVQAQQKTLGTFGDWTAIVDGSGNKHLCYIGSAPKKSEGKYTRRGDTYFLVTNSPADKTKGEVSVAAGYTYKNGEDAEAKIGRKRFRLLTSGENAWAYDAGSDKAMVAALKAGRQMIIRGTSSRGTTTTDTYSLSGFTAALAAINKACGSSYVRSQ